MQKSKRVKLLHDITSNMEAAQENMAQFYEFIYPTEVNNNWLWVHLTHITDSLSVLGEVGDES